MLRGRCSSLIWSMVSVRRWVALRFQWSRPDSMKSPVHFISQDDMLGYTPFHKSFFGRTYNNLSSINECKNQGRCVINKKNRTSCKACRLRKCLMVGMSKSGSRYGRRSNWFKIHCLLQEQTGHGLERLEPSSFHPGLPTPPLPSPTPTQPSPSPTTKKDDKEDIPVKDMSSPDSMTSDTSSSADFIATLRSQGVLDAFPSPFYDRNLLAAAGFPPSPLTTLGSPPMPFPPRFFLPTPPYMYARKHYIDAVLGATPPSMPKATPPPPPEVVVKVKAPLPIQDSPMDLSVKCRDSPDTSRSMTPSPPQPTRDGARNRSGSDEENDPDSNDGECSSEEDRKSPVLQDLKARAAVDLTGSLSGTSS
ncbi:unnamed protein product [Cyprideis torosa]|uniref:Uncharacterized protein n=1 Tax=Cyprideis torosa TaxID=163714 RepID=A0A7R8ZGM3_9CRUS|nr:unnamed protein product [Cyprideis torosa]CAG0880426.1 unnamed protein product [Cyprideis torosa]